ncbi:MAG: hypothetical protein D6820_10565, partial [Lentisphaerae bacterium]
IQSYSKLPYIFTMAGFPQTQTVLFRDFPDVFAPEFEKLAEDFAHQLESIRDNPLVIGYFMTNEPKWAFIPEFDLAAHLLRFPKPSQTRSELLAWLRKRYEGDVARLNQKWGSSFDSWDAFDDPLDVDQFSGAREDTSRFTAIAVQRFVEIPARACKRIAPNHLNLGLRWAWIHSDYQLLGAEYLDAFSINCYQLRPDPELIRRLSEKSGRPLVIGEFHIGSLDRGLPSGGIRNTMTMQESVNAYRYYVEQAASLPQLIGVHYFQWNDQHVMGRFDGENMQIGLNDITGRLYPEWLDMCATLHPRLYAIHAGHLAPYETPPEVVPQGTLCW